LVTAQPNAHEGMVGVGRAGDIMLTDQPLFAAVQP
jgi:hypothetical protein